MLIITLGCGNAFSTKNFNQQFLLIENNRKMLIDCGWSTPLALKNAGITVKDIDDVYISHAHADHAGGLEYLAFMRYDWINRPKKASYNDTYAPTLYGNSTFIKELWKHTLSGGLDSMEGFNATIETFFKVPEITNSFDWEGWNFKLVQQVHIMAGESIAATYGLLVSKEGHKTIYFTTDSQHCSPNQMTIFYKMADIIIQDCECTGIDTTNKQFKFKSGVHANYAELAGWNSANAPKLSSDIKSKMLLSHYQDFVSEGIDGFGNKVDWNQLSKDDGFSGFIHVGQQIEM
jgi:ribonuclease BN (tRNA processing enzyme)